MWRTTTRVAEVTDKKTCVGGFEQREKEFPAPHLTNVSSCRPQKLIIEKIPFLLRSSCAPSCLSLCLPLFGFIGCCFLLDFFFFFLYSLGRQWPVNNLLPHNNNSRWGGALPFTKEKVQNFDFIFFLKKRRERQLVIVDYPEIAVIFEKTGQ